MTMVREIMRISPCDTGLVSHVLCDVTLDDGPTHRVCAERDSIGDWRLDRTYKPRDLHAILLDAAGSLANEIETRQLSALEAVTVKELWRYTPVARRLRAIGLDVTCNGKTYRVSANRDRGEWVLLVSPINRRLHDLLLRAVIGWACGVDRELRQLRRQLSSIHSETSRSRSLPNGGVAHLLSSMD